MNNKTIDKNSENLSFKDYYESLPAESPRVVIRDRIAKELGIAIPSLYDKIRNQRWTNLEKRAISELLGMKVEQLFPEEQPCE